MQQNPEKLFSNYNEFVDPSTQAPFQYGILRVMHDQELATALPEQIAEAGILQVNNKINEILGDQNRLTSNDLPFPAVHFVSTLPERPNWAGFFSPSENMIVVVIDKAKSPAEQTKVFIHEYIHFLSHNGWDAREQLTKDSPITQNNNIGFNRFFGLDIRAGKEGQTTSDYFLSFNEAVTEMLAQDIMPGVHETYGSYIGLLNQVIDDAMKLGMGGRDETGVFIPWSRQEYKNYIYRCFFRGDLAGFTRLLQTTYQEYDISEQQFGLMTHRNDLPSMIEKQMMIGPNGPNPKPSPTTVAVALQKRLNYKTSKDYVTDVIGPDPNDSNDPDVTRFGTEYDDYLVKHKIVHVGTETVGGKTWKYDNGGYIIYQGDEAAQLLDGIKTVLDTMLAEGATKEAISTEMDRLLFEANHISMLSDGFRDFYIYKHSKIDNL